MRDLNEVRALGFHYFARYAVVSHANFGIVDVNGPVTLDGCTVNPGDVIHGDVNGVVVVPAATLERLPAVVQNIRDAEGKSIAFIKGPDFTLDAFRQRSGYSFPITRPPSTSTA